MNQFFNIKRFGRLLSYDLKINYKQYLIAAAICFAAVFVVTYIDIDTWNIEYKYLFYKAYLISLLIFAAGFVVYAGLSFPAFSSKKSTISYLMLPASTFEKFTAEFILRIILGLILSLLIFWVAVNCAAEVKVLVYNLEHHTNVLVEHFSFIPICKRLLTNNFDDYTARTIILTAGGANMLFATFIIFAFTVRLFFKRFGVVKTAAAGIGIVLFLIWLTVTFATDFITNYFFQNKLQAIMFNRYFVIILLIFCVTLLVTGYYKLKEKKI